MEININMTFLLRNIGVRPLEISVSNYKSQDILYMHNMSWLTLSLENWLII